MSRLVLIKHASPEVQPDVPSRAWRLSTRGRESCTPLANALAPLSLDTILSSDEPKAIETAELIAGKLNLPTRSAADLHEHDRSNVPHLRSGEFISLVELFFRRKSERVLGLESADEALLRFSRAVDAALAAHVDENLAIVSHGTVIALYLESVAARPGFPLWREMGLPSFAVIDRKSGKLSQFVPRVS